MSYGSIIAAISTPSGKGGVAIIRISGEGAVGVAEKIFFPKNKKSLREIPARLQVYGDVIYDGEYIDDGMATVFRAPASYTGEDTVEISCHGGVLVTKRVLEAVLAAGAVPAESGEFTRRAFINGKLSLTDAEAIGNLLEARTASQAKLYSQAARGLLSDKIAEIRKGLTEILSSVFARIDYPDEDLGDFSDSEARERLVSIKSTITALMRTYPTGKAVSEGINAVICGKPNAGKSSLYNAMLGEDAAIVTDVEGTTRDVLSRVVSLGRVMLNLSDTAGIREDERTDKVEKIGIERSRAAIATAELVIAVFDGSLPFDARDEDILEAVKGTEATRIAVINKCDLEEKLDVSLIDAHFNKTVSVSAKSGAIDAVGALTEVIEELFTDGKLSLGNDAIVSSARQNAALARALGFVDAAIAAQDLGVYTDAVSSEVERALGAIAEIDGRAVSESVVSEIFSKFCVGK